MAAWIATALYLLDLAIKVIALGVVPKNRRPSSGMAWLLLILIIPFLGFVIFLVLGRTRLERRRYEQQAEVNAIVAERTADVPTLETDFPGPAYVESVATLNRNLGAQPAMPGNRVDLFSGYSDSVAAMTAEVEKASTWVHVEFYITAWDDVTGPFYEALVRAVERGVTVRLLFDHLGSRGIPGYKEFTARLDTTGIEWHPMLPIAPFKRPAGPAQPPQDPGDRRRGGVHRVAEPDRARLQQAEEPRARARVGRAGGARGRPGGERAQPPLRHRLVQRDRGQARRGDRYGAATGRRDRGAGDPERAGLRDREQPARLHDVAVLGTTSAVDHQSLLRAGRVPAVRHHHGGPARGRRGAVRERGR